MQQRPRLDGSPKYSGSWHVLKETFRWDYLSLNYHTMGIFFYLKSGHYIYI